MAIHDGGSNSASGRRPRDMRYGAAVAAGIGVALFLSVMPLIPPQPLAVDAEEVAEPPSLRVEGRIDKRGVTLLVDPMSIQYLMGAEIDYREDLNGAQFVIRNPNASTTCGCGSSFGV